MTTEKHEHEYKAVVYKVQIPHIRHWSYEDHLVGTTEEERVKLFCVGCGNTIDLGDKSEA